MLGESACIYYVFEKNLLQIKIKCKDINNYEIINITHYNFQSCKYNDLNDWRK